MKIALKLFVVDAASNGDLQLVDGRTYREGRVEMYYNSVWHTFCDDFWDDSDATVVCKQLGFGSYGTALTGSSVLDGSGKIWPNNMRCKGTENNILSCPRNSVNSRNCAHHEDAGVQCYGDPPS